MSWAIGHDGNWNRDVGYGVPSICDHPGCNKEIDRGLAYVCGDAPYGGDVGCGLFFCEDHSSGHPRLCERCQSGSAPFTPKPDVRKWLVHKLNDESWSDWRKAYPAEVEEIRKILNQ